MYDDFSLPYVHQKPIFSPLSCSLQAPEPISGENTFLKFLTQRVILLCVAHIIKIVCECVKPVENIMAHAPIVAHALFVAEGV